jgi:hypothetical protein
LSSLEWRDRAYSDTLERILDGLEARRKADPSFSIPDAEGVLKHLYIQDGNDCCSRGMLQDAVLAATVAAYEQFIDAWKAEGAPFDGSIS